MPRGDSRGARKPIAKHPCQGIWRRPCERRTWVPLGVLACPRCRKLEEVAIRSRAWALQRRRLLGPKERPQRKLAHRPAPIVFEDTDAPYGRQALLDTARKLGIKKK